MKTSKTFAAAISTLSLAFVILLTGCEKAETPEMSTTISSNNEMAAALPTVPKTKNFEMITIDHSNIGSQQANYNVTIMADGKLTFSGRKNTAVIGELTYKLSPDMMNTLKNLFANQNFESINDEIVNPDLPTLTVTYRSEASLKPTSRTNIDGRNNKLTIFNNKLEQLINIKAFIAGADANEEKNPVLNF